VRLRTPTDYIILGTLFPGEKHGYEIMRFMESALDGALRVGTSQLYILLKRMQQEGLLESRAETQYARPSKRIFHVTELGRKTFLSWLETPVKHVRDLRIEFLCKLFFFRQLSMQGAVKLVSAQIKVLERVQPLRSIFPDRKARLRKGDRVKVPS